MGWKGKDWMTGRRRALFGIINEFLSLSLSFSQSWWRKVNTPFDEWTWNKNGMKRRTAATVWLNQKYKSQCFDGVYFQSTFKKKERGRNCKKKRECVCVKREREKLVCRKGIENDDIEKESGLKGKRDIERLYLMKVQIFWIQMLIKKEGWK